MICHHFQYYHIFHRILGYWIQYVIERYVYVHLCINQFSQSLGFCDVFANFIRWSLYLSDSFYAETSENTNWSVSERIFQDIEWIPGFSEVGKRKDESPNNSGEVFSEGMSLLCFILQFRTFCLCSLQNCFKFYNHLTRRK